jgi:Tol biopolymer transport system component
MNADGGRLKRRTFHPATDGIGSFSRNGQWIYFMSTRTGREEIWKTPAAGGEPRQVTTAGGLVAIESHNGDMLFFTKPDGGALWQMPVGKGPETKVLENVDARSFMPAEDGIYFARRTDQGYSFQFFNSATGHVLTSLCSTV